VERGNPSQTLLFPRDHVRGVVIGADHRRPRFRITEIELMGRSQQALRGLGRIQMDHGDDPGASVGHDRDAFIAADHDRATARVTNSRLCRRRRSTLVRLTATVQGGQ
jgi:hypothetical protein